MKFRVHGGPLASPVSIEAKHSDSFKSIMKKVQKAAGKATPLDGFDLYTAATSAVSGNVEPAVGPLRSKDTPKSLELDRKQKEPHVLVLVQGGEDGRSTTRSLSHSTSGVHTTATGDAESDDAASSASVSAASTPRATADYRQRMQAIFLKYDPEKINKVDVALERYAGYEEEVIQQLVKRYGPEPAAGEVDTSQAAVARALAAAAEVSTRSEIQGPRSVATSPNTGASYHDRLVAIYTTYEPEKLSKVDGTLRRYAGREEEVIQQLLKKYGPEPRIETTAPAPPPPSQLSRAATEVSSAPVSAVAAGRAELAAAGASAYDVSTMSSSVAADSLPVTPRNAQGEHEGAGSSSSGGRVPSSLPGPLTYRDRLTAMYATYEPAKLRLVDGTLAKYKGREEAVLRQLVKVYGPEPSAEQVAAAKESAMAASRARQADTAFSASSSVDVGPSGAEDVAPAVVVEVPALTPAAEQRSAEPLRATEAVAVSDGPPPTPESAALAPTAAVAAGGVASAPAVASEEADAGATVSGSSPLSPMTERPPLPQSTKSPADGDERRYRERLVALYHTYNPSKLHTVEGTLRKFTGKEEAAIQQLVRRYGPEPPALTAEEALELLRGASGGSPVTTPRTHSTATQELPESSSSAPSSKPASPVEGSVDARGGYRDRIHAILATHDPDKVDRVDPILDRYRGKEEEVIAKLEQRYGVHSDTATPAPVMAVADGAPAAAAKEERPRPDTPPPAPVAVEATPTAVLARSTHSPLAVAAASSPPAAADQPGGVPVKKAEAPLSDDDATRPTAPPSQRSSSCESTHPHALAGPPEEPHGPVANGKVASTPTVAATPTVDASAAPHKSQRVQPPSTPDAVASSAAARPRNHAALAAVAARHLGLEAQKAVLRRYWAAWQDHHVTQRAAALVREELWVGTAAPPSPSRPVTGATAYRLNDSVEPAYVVQSLTGVAAQEAGASSGGARAFSSEVEIAARTLLAALRHCVKSRVVEVRSAEEEQLASAFLAYWAGEEHMCPVRDTPELARALHQAAHLIGQLDDLMTVIRTQAGQLQQLKSLHKDVVQRMEAAPSSQGDVRALQQQLSEAHARQRELEEELRRVSTGAVVSARTRATNGQRKPSSSPVRRAYPSAEERKDAQIGRLQQELAKARNSLFASREAEEKMRVQMQQSIARETRREREERRREGGVGGVRSRPVSLSPRGTRSRSGPAGQRSNATPRGGFSHAIAVGTPRRPTASAARLDHDGRAVSSIRKPYADANDRSNVSINSNTLWPTSRFVMAEEVERGPCPNCLTPLTSCSADARGPAEAKAAFCFSCRRSFTFGELRARDARDAVDGL